MCFCKHFLRNAVPTAVSFQLLASEYYSWNILENYFAIIINQRIIIQKFLQFLVAS